jgi:hypothetical protein
MPLEFSSSHIKLRFGDIRNEWIFVTDENFDYDVQILNHLCRKLHRFNGKIYFVPLMDFTFESGQNPFRFFCRLNRLNLNGVCQSCYLTKTKNIEVQAGVENPNLAALLYLGPPVAVVRWREYRCSAKRKLSTIVSPLVPSDQT